METINLENEIVQLRPVQLADIDAITVAANDPRIWPHLSVTLLDRTSVENYVKKQLQNVNKASPICLRSLIKKQVN